MPKEFEWLEKVQEFDLQLEDLLQSREQSPRKLALLDQELAQDQNALQQELAKQEKLKKDLDKRKEQMEEETRLIKMKQDRVAEIRNQKEYQAHLREIEASRMEMAILKEDLKIIEDRLKEQDGVCSEAQKEFDEMTSKNQSQKQEIETKLSSLDKEFSELKSQRDDVAKNVSKGILSQYERIRKRTGGRALLLVVEPFCPNCNMSIPPQRFNELIRMDKFIACESCQLLFYWRNEKD